MRSTTLGRFWPLLMVILTSVAFLQACSKTGDGVQQASTAIEVWKTPTCGCCGAWVDHLKENGFEVKVNDVDDTASFRAALGMPQEYGSCHSARVQGYAIEGHVPAADIKKLLTDKPDAVGLSVPGMPMGSPGMEHPEFPSKRHEYDVLLVDKSGGVRSYTRYEAK